MKWHFVTVQNAKNECRAYDDMSQHMEGPRYVSPCAHWLFELFFSKEFGDVIQTFKKRGGNLISNSWGSGGVPVLTIRREFARCVWFCCTKVIEKNNSIRLKCSGWKIYYIKLQLYTFTDIQCIRPCTDVTDLLQMFGVNSALKTVLFKLEKGHHIDQHVALYHMEE